MCEDYTVQRYAEFVYLPKTQESFRVMLNQLSYGAPAYRWAEKHQCWALGGRWKWKRSKSVQLNAQFGLVLDANVGRAIRSRVNIQRIHNPNANHGAGIFTYKTGWFMG